MENLNLISRLVHLTSSGLLFGTILLNYLYSTNDFLEEDPNFFLYMVPLAGTLSLISGLASHHILKPAKPTTEALAAKTTNTAASKSEKAAKTAVDKAKAPLSS
jgi:hypothetical protein